MSNDSTCAGWLTPVSDGPHYDEALERQLSQWVKALAGLPDGMVKPRWTPEQAAQPAAGVNWCGFGITGIDSDAGPAFVNQNDDSAELWRHEEITCMASFYGKGAQGIASQFRDGLMLSQNNAIINVVGLSLAGFSGLIPAPELFNQQWVRRYDITIRLRRKIIRTYGIKSLVDASVNLSGE